MAGLVVEGAVKSEPFSAANFRTLADPHFLDSLKGENADFAQKFPDPRTANHCNHGFLPRGSPAKSEQKL